MAAATLVFAPAAFAAAHSAGSVHAAVPEDVVARPMSLQSLLQLWQQLALFQLWSSQLWQLQRLPWSLPVIHTGHGQPGQRPC